MGFFHNDAKAAEKRAPAKKAQPKGVIPIASLNELGCQVCPRDKDRLKTPKMEPAGAMNPRLYILTAAPSLQDDERGVWGADKAGREIAKQLPRDSDRWVRWGGVIQCGTDTVAVGKHETECCRQRVVRDIEESQPLVILGIGDAPLAWATGLEAYAPRWRGRLLTVKVGSHVCLYYPINYPNYVFKESKYGPSEHEVATRHDIAQLVRMLEVDNSLPVPDYQEGPFDRGVEIITGTETGDFQRLELALSQLAKAPRSALDLETNGLRAYQAKPRVWTAAVGTFERTVAFPLDHPEGWGTEHQQRRVWSLFTDYLLESGIKECHNLAFEMEWLAYFIDPRILRLTDWDDTMSMAHTIDARPGTKSLDVQTAIYYGFNLKSQSNIDAARIIEYPLKKVLRYNGMDTKWTNYHSRTLRPIIEADPKLRWAHERKVRLASTLVLTERQGMPVDYQTAVDMEARMQAAATEIDGRVQRTPEVKAYREKFGTFSVTNNDHVLRLLDKICKRDEIVKSDKNGTRMSTDESVLSEIPKNEVPSAALVLEHRGVEKILSTYVRPLVTKRIISADGLIHPKYSSMTAVTGRLAGEDPNPQNWPKRKHREVRGVVRARLNRWLLAADYGQIEFRVAGMASGDDNLVKYCWTGYDVHAYWAKRMVEEYPRIKDWIVSEFEVDWDEKGMKTLRQESKNKWVFPSIFGAAVASRAANLHLPRDIADALDREFWDEFPGVKKWQTNLLKSYSKHLYVETLGGIRRYGPMTPNEVINMPIQGTAAEIVTEAMCALSERAMAEDNENIQPMFNGHDDLTFEPYDSALEATLDTVVHEMCKPRFRYINVPLVVEVSLGERWSDLKEIGIYRSDKLFNLRNPYQGN